MFKSPLIDFVREVKAAGLEEQIIYLQRGQLYELEVPPERWSLPARALPATGPAPSPRRG